MLRYFTLDEAQKLIPEIESLLSNLNETRKQHDAAEHELEKLTSRIQMMGGSMIHPGEILRLRSRKESGAQGLKTGVESIQAYGCVLKDLDLGLVDFPTLYHGQEVYLCWRTGETAIEFWHGLTEGFAGRKPIDDEFLANHRGGVQ